MNITKRIITSVFVLFLSMILIKPAYSAEIEKAKDKVEKLSKIATDNPDEVYKFINGKLAMFSKKIGDTVVMASKKFMIIKFQTFDDKGNLESTGFMADFSNNGTINRYAIVPGRVDGIKDEEIIVDLLSTYDEMLMELGFSEVRKKSKNTAMNKRKIYFIEYEKKIGGLIDMELDSGDPIDADQIEALQMLFEEILESIG